ncbi:translocation/assembly module TamB domain-containing protein [uncultured Draconibacterium sp.]|uniref:translocation/assembly module TamB domain-containing protein n=1 Tax=uncultured Draconibacterium sp. TaxID=1573823 RepID=UPI0032177DDF
MRNKWKYLLFIPVGFILLLVALLLFTQTAFFKEKAKQQLVNILEKQLNLTLEVEKIEGNWYNHLEVHKVHFTDNDSTVVSLEMLKLNYKLLPLRHKVIQIDSLILDKPQIRLWQKKDSTWNLASNVKSESENTGSASNAFAYTVDVKSVEIRDGKLSVSSFSKFIPTKTTDINLRASGEYSDVKTKVRLDTFYLKTENPFVELKNLSGVYTMDKNGIQIDSLRFVAGESNLDFEGEYLSSENMNANVTNGKISNKDLAIFLPTFKLLCSPAVNANFETSNDSVFAWAELQHNNQSLRAEFSMDKLSELISQKETVSYSTTLLFTNFKTKEWIEVAGHSGLLNGNFKLSGPDLLNFKTSAKVAGELKRSKYNGFNIDSLVVSGLYNADSVDAKVGLKSALGDLSLEGRLTSISTKPKYEVHVVGDDLNITSFVPELIDTKFDGTLDAEGEGVNSNDIFAKARINFKSSTIYSLPFDSLTALVQLKNNVVSFDSLNAFAPGGEIMGDGTLSLDSLFLNSSYTAQIHNLDVIKPFVELPVTFDSATTKGTVYGPVSTLKVNGDVSIFNADGYSAKLETAKGNYLVAVEDSVIVKVNSSAYNLSSGSLLLDSANVDFGYVEGNIDLAARVFVDESFSVSAATQFNIGDTMAIDVHSFEAKTILSDYYLPDTMKVRLYGYDRLNIENLELKDRNQDDFLLEANGSISNTDSNRFEVLIKHFDLSLLNRFMESEDSLKGLFNGNLSIRGSSLKPVIKGNAQLVDPVFGPYSVSSIESDFTYENELGSAELSIPEFGETFNASLSAPFKVSIDSLEFIYDLPSEFNADLYIKSLDLSEIITSYMPDDSIKGVINGKINASGEIENPLINGYLGIDRGKYINNNLGIDYNDIKANVKFEGNKIQLDTFLIHQKGGLISVTGEVEFDSTIIAGTITSSSLQLDANKFFVTKHRNYEVLIDAKTFIKTGEKNPEFGGKVKVIRSDIFLPALMSDGKTDIEHDVPLLVEALRNPADSLVINTGAPAREKNEDRNNNKFTEQLTGRLNVEIPKNTWIRTNDMRIELNGELEIVKTGPYFEIFGNVDVVRGYYILYGRKLNITESQIVFQGGEDFDPTLNIETEYVFRGMDKEKRYLNLRISGELSEPDITFVLDGTEITETDGVSILIFGATSDEIGYGAQNGILGSVGSNAVTSLVTSQLSKTIGTQFNLDMIEVTATENWQSAAFVVGKYITNDLFVIYQRGFGEVDGDEITPESIILEYELNEKLFLRLQSGSSKESGMDVILKFEQEVDRPVQGIKKE